MEGLGLQTNDLVIADRSYGLWRHIRVALQACAYFIVRITWANLPLLTADGTPFDLVDWLKSLPVQQTEAETTVVVANDPQGRPLRLVVGRLPEDKLQEARERVRQQARSALPIPTPC
ncbi:MAG TPA: hypothetical protein EYH31_11270 [Anaerolineae bacterium]|nr:hypothetical protein [Anaerolineae bacterium]